MKTASRILAPSIIALLATGVPPAAAQTDAGEPTFTVAELRADFDTLRSLLREHHPALYRYRDQQAFDSVFDSVRALLDHEMTELEFFRLAAPVVAMVGCLHTWINLSEPFRTRARERARFPLGIDYLDGRAYVVQHYGAEPVVPVGSEVLAINDESASSLLQEFLTAIPADGYNRTRIVHIVNRYSYHYVSMFFGYPETYRVEYRAPGAVQSDTLMVRGLPLDSVTAARRERYPESLGRPGLELEILNSLETAVLTVGGFGARPMDAFSAFVDSAFTSMEAAGVETLVIDVRGNGGGPPDNAVAILRHLANGPFTYFAPEVGGQLTEPFEPSEPRFRGDVYVLMDGGSLSTTGHFLSLVKYHALGVLVGEESGATFSCNDASLPFTLPNTGMVGQVARKTFETRVTGFSRNGRIQPELEVVPTVDDLVAGRDVTMDHVLGLIREKRAASAR